MEFGVVFFIFNVLLFGAVTYYFYHVRKQQLVEDSLLVEKRKMLRNEIESDRSDIDKQLVDAKKRTEYILSESQTLAREIIEQLQRALSTTSILGEPIKIDIETFEQKLPQIEEQIKSQYVARIHKTMERLEMYEVSQAHKVESLAQEQQDLSHVQMQQMKIHMLEKMKKEIEEYKKSEIELLNEKIKKIVAQAAIDVFGHALTQQEHEELVNEAIKKALEKNIL
jgi:hypothetical protein